MKQVAVIQCVKRSKALKRRILRPDSSSARARSGRARNRTPRARAACRAPRCRRSRAAHPPGSRGSRGLAAARASRPCASGMLTRPCELFSSRRSWSSLTDIAVGFVRARGCWPRPSPRPTTTIKPSARARSGTHGDRTSAFSPFCRYAFESGCDAPSVTSKRDRSRDRRSSSPRRPSRSRAAPPAPCRSAR